MSEEVKRKSRIAPRRSLPSFESSLDALISRANETLASERERFDPAAREAELKQKIAGLRKDVAGLASENEKLQAELAAARVREAQPKPRPYVATISAFVLGAAGMFAISLWRMTDREPEAERTIAPVSVPPPTPTATATPTVTPIPPPTVTPIPAPDPLPAVTPSIATQLPAPSPAVAPEITRPRPTPAPPRKPTDKPAEARPAEKPAEIKPAEKPVPTPDERPKPGPKPEGEPKPGDEGLYNPF